MSEPSYAPEQVEPSEHGPAVADGEEVDALPVLAGAARAISATARAGELTRAGAIPTVQAAAVAAGGFVAGAAVVGLVTRRRRHAPALAKGARRPLRRRSGRDAGAGELVHIVGSRSLLVDVHLLGRS